MDNLLPLETKILGKLIKYYLSTLPAIAVSMFPISLSITAIFVPFISEKR